MQEQTIYLKAEKTTIVSNKKVFLQDIIKLYGTDKKLIKELNNVVALIVPSDKRCKFSISILKVMELLHKEHSSLSFENVGEKDFVVEYIPPAPKKYFLEIVKTIIVCLVAFFGAAFTIMTFNEDVSVAEVFSLFYGFVLGEGSAGNGILEICYSIGLPLGVILFYNHFTRIKIDSDPTPIQIQVRLYEEDMNKTIIENASRENRTIDAQ